MPSGDVHKTGMSRDGKEDGEDDVSSNSIHSGSAMSSSVRLVCIHVHVHTCTMYLKKISAACSS